MRVRCLVVHHSSRSSPNARAPASRTEGGSRLRTPPLPLPPDAHMLGEGQAVKHARAPCCSPCLAAARPPRHADPGDCTLLYCKLVCTLSAGQHLFACARDADRTWTCTPELESELCASRTAVTSFTSIVFKWYYIVHSIHRASGRVVRSTLVLGFEHWGHIQSNTTAHWTPAAIGLRPTLVCTGRSWLLMERASAPFAHTAQPGP